MNCEQWRHTSVFQRPASPSSATPRVASMSLHRSHRRRPPEPSSLEPAESSVRGSMAAIEPSSSARPASPKAGGRCQSSETMPGIPATHVPLTLLVRAASEGSESVTGLPNTWLPHRRSPAASHCCGHHNPAASTAALPSGLGVRRGTMTPPVRSSTARLYAGRAACDEPGGPGCHACWSCSVLPMRNSTSMPASSARLDLVATIRRRRAHGHSSSKKTPGSALGPPGLSVAVSRQDPVAFSCQVPAVEAKSRLPRPLKLLREEVPEY